MGLFTTQALNQKKNFVLEFLSIKQNNYNRKLSLFKSCLDKDTTNSMNNNIKSLCWDLQTPSALACQGTDQYQPVPQKT